MKSSSLRESGELEGRLENGLHVFKGIPYAAPPVGELRWRAPQPPQKWTGIRQAYAYGNDAPQKNPWAPHQDEDCLYLNVWAPARGVGFPPAELERNGQAGSLSHLAPVMVWIHGGGFINGSGRINGESFAKQGIVKTSAWTYYFDYVRGRGRNSRGAGHGSEVPFVFDRVILAGAKDREIINAMQGHWIQFAKTGDPNGPGLPAWSAHTSAKSMTLVYGQESVRAERNWHKARFDLLFEAIAATWPGGTGFQPVTTSPSTLQEHRRQ